MKISSKKLAYLLIIVAILLLAMVIFRQTDSLSKSLQTIRGADQAWILLAVMALFGSYVFASCSLIALSIKKIEFSKTLLVQIASGLTTKLVPAGLGGLALNIRYLQKQGHTALESGSVMAINGSLGLVGHITIIASTVILGFSGPIQIKAPSSLLYALLIVFGLSI
ncbi:MAG: lysylphosphatidylglycerol synthase domain-containing protein, partial [bacterium]|nr:lysylphosphatidylglycerol synthase domain-containing protein [bacterium]